MSGYIYNKISFRADRVGGALEASLTEDEFNALKLRSHIVFLIHGYNNTEQAAADAYEGFNFLQRELAELDYVEPIAHDRVVEIYWPGDADWGILSALYYMNSIGRARQTAQALAKELERAARESGFKQIDIVAHSMGCRLSLELLKALQGIQNILVNRIVFMAGAVPVNRLTTSGDRLGLRAGYDAKLSEGALSLYSGNDSVLGYAFPAGQTLAGNNEGFFPTALGRERWVHTSVPNNLVQMENYGAGHSDYWGWNLDKLDQGEFANQMIHEFLQLESVIPRVPISRFTESRITPNAGSAEIDEIWSWD